MIKYDIQNRRYVGSKYKISDEIIDLILEQCEGNKFFDVFGGTGIMTQKMVDHADHLIINDFLYSNEVIYKAFFDSNDIDLSKLVSIVDKFNNTIEYNDKVSNYCSHNFGDKYFSMEDAYIIGEIRESLNDLYNVKEIDIKEYNVLLASLIYSIDKIANTVGHYDAFRRIKDIRNKFELALIKPVSTHMKQIDIYRKDANELVLDIKDVDISFIDPPYNSRQYSRFYHVLENIVTWEKPKLYGVAMKPEAENMSDYSKRNAKDVFRNLIQNLDSKYIVVTYNNTYNPKSSSSRNKIEIEDMEQILNEKGDFKKISIGHSYFNAGKTEFNDHKEYVYIVEVK